MVPITSCIHYPFFVLCNDMFTMLVYATYWPSMHLYMLAYMFMHESCLLVCCPCFNTMKLWTFDPNLHFSLANTTFCLLSCSFAFSLLHLLSCFFACHGYLVYLLYASFICSLHLFFPLLICWFLSLPLHVHTWSEDAWSQGTVFQAQAKRVWMQACRYKPSGNVQQFQASLIWLCTLLNPLASSLLSLLDGLYQVYHVMYHSFSSLENGDTCLLSCTYILGHALGM